MNKDGHFSSEELSALTEIQIRTLAERNGYTISGSTKAELITSFLSAQSTDEAADESAADANADEEYTKAELETLSIYEIKELASTLGYTITGTTKATLIASFLEAQTAKETEDIAGADADSSGDYDADELGTLTIAEIKKLATTLGYEITGTTKAELITSFLTAQEAASDDDDPDIPGGG